ncbi:hypothetical protein EDD18DRAFT_1150191 [Armillaria luteobubalina]|uniref:Uncharacterized protein n=1 Tax=Armillaria luteobubalina TaxID=153913 RepID=A0AA39QDS6_9AGAR|nr:hypothetical protein EDD18DRAFT_1150191 [Armillaria luteobubalina]
MQSPFPCDFSILRWFDAQPSIEITWPTLLPFWFVPPTLRLHVLHQHGVKKRSYARLSQKKWHQQTRHRVNFPVVGAVWMRYYHAFRNGENLTLRGPVKRVLLLASIIPLSAGMGTIELKTQCLYSRTKLFVRQTALSAQRLSSHGSLNGLEVYTKPIKKTEVQGLNSTGSLPSTCHGIQYSRWLLSAPRSTKTTTLFLWPEPSSLPAEQCLCGSVCSTNAFSDVYTSILVPYGPAQSFTCRTSYLFLPSFKSTNSAISI